MSGLSAEARKALMGDLSFVATADTIHRMKEAEERVFKGVARLIAEAEERGAARVRERVEALVEKWRYKGEFGWGAWQEGHGPDIEGQVLAEAASELRAALTTEAHSAGGES